MLDAPPVIEGLAFEGELGRGAHSIVYRARRGDRSCAVKVARSGARHGRWFRREAAALARVRHTGVPGVLEVGEVDGRPYLAMELIPGPTLAEVTSRARLEGSHALELAIRLADIGVAIHSRGLIHRDIKPKNIVVSAGRGTALVDFGLATQTLPFVDGMAAGTTSYAAPEQLVSPHLVDGRADLYAIGRVLEDCCDLDSVKGLRGVVARLLLGDPASRFQSAEELRADLVGLREGRRKMHRVGPQRRSGAELVGRRSELRRLESAWENATRGSGSVFLVEGPPGGGKTRLLDELALVVSASGQRICLRAGGGSPVPVAAVRRLFEDYVRMVSDLPREARGPWKDMLADSVPEGARGELAAIAPMLVEFLSWGASEKERTVPASGPLDPESLAEMAAQTILRLASRIGGLAIVVDDIQWLDPVSREILVRLALTAASSHVLVVVAARSDARSLPPMQRFARALGASRLTVLSVRPLDEDGLHDLIASYLGVDTAARDLVARVAGLCDGTPLSALDMISALVDSGALRPHWGTWEFDLGRSRQLELPPGSLAHLARRLRDTPAATVRVLQVAAVIGVRFDLDLLADVLEVAADDVRVAISEAARAGVVEFDQDESPRFVHDTLREALLERMTPDQRAESHRAVARVLAAGPADQAASLFSVVEHLRRGGSLEDPAHAYELGYAAAQTAAAATDHETGLACFELAERAANDADIELDLEFLTRVAESHIAVGAHEDSLAKLRRALDLSRGLDRGRVLSRIAWVYGRLGDPERAWKALDDAFVLAGAQLPREHIRSFATTLADGGRLALGASGRRAETEDERRRIELLCELHYQNARLGVEGEKPLRLIQSSVSMLRCAEQLGPSSQLVRASAGFGAFSAVLGRHKAGRRHIARALEGARALADPVLIADAIKHAILLEYWTGKTERATQLTEELFENYGAWIEVSDYLQLAASARSIESTRGRPERALRWMELALDRVRRHGRVPRMFGPTVVRPLTAACSTAGRDEVRQALLAELEIGDTQEAGTFALLYDWGPRALTILNQEAFGEELTTLIAEFEATRPDPKRAHLLVVEYYYCVAYAFAAQCQVLARPERALIERLDAAIANLRSAARFDVLKTHLYALEGDQLRLQGNFKKARARLAKARALAEKELVPWVLYEVARCEARMLRAEGREEAARERARVAAVHAHTHGAARRLASVEREFGLEPLGGAGSSVVGSSLSASASHRNLQLSALVKVVNAAAQEQRLEPQAKTVLDEMLKVVGVDRGILLFERGEPDSARLLTARTRSGDDWDPSAEGYPRLLKQVCDQGRPIAPGDDAVLAESSGPFDTQRLIAAPLFVQSEVVGALILQRGPSETRFTSSDVELVAALTPQVPIALELARLLEERERLQETLRQAQKMEGVGQLASGIAHDFNNMLTAIMSSVDALGGGETLSPPQQQALEVVRDSAERARQLTSQLLSFSRRQVLDMTTLDVGVAIERVLPMLQRMLGAEIDVHLQRRSGAQFAETDRSSLENMIVNLAVNARDAMPDGGTLEIIVDDLDVDESVVAQGASRTGRHVRIRVRDTGSGMPPEIVDKVFEPFFTTKPVGSGTGLGLASAYGFIKQCGGHIEVESEVGRGTTFTILLPAAVAPSRVSGPRPVAPVRAVQSGLTVLVVEDEGLVRRATQASLEREGYVVRFAEHGEEALQMLAAGEKVDLIITDVMMPTMDGPTFVHNLDEAGYTVPVLLVSGYADPSVIGRLDPRAPVAFLAKPYSREELVVQLQELVARGRVAS